MKAYIEDDFKYMPLWLYAATLGLKDKGFEIARISKKYLDHIPKNEKSVFVGGVEATIDYFNLNDIVIPKPLNVPVELNTNEFLERYLRVTTMGEFKTSCRQLLINDLFVKPYDKVKAFASGVVSKVSTMELAYSDVPDEEMVLMSNAIDFISEYRCFVHKGDLKGIQFYKGDLTVFPQMTAINKMIKAYTEAPVAYTLDVGIIQQQESWGHTRTQTLLVECNDMWSVDNYGFNHKDYATMLRDRWFEIIKNKK